jgi:hypothetical protein
MTWMTKLTVRFATADVDSLQAGIELLRDQGRLSAAIKNGRVLAREAVDLVRAALNCEWRTDEEIAEQIVRAIDERRREHGVID